MDTARYAELFATEARDHLSEITRALTRLESAPSSPEPVQQIFRSVHTIKGMAGAMGYLEVAGLSHSFESMLETLRRGTAVDATALDLLFRATGALERLVDAAVGGTRAPDCSDLLHELATAGTALQPAGSHEEDAPSPRPDAGRAAAGAGTTIQVRLRSDSPLRGARARLIVSALARHGNVLDVNPPLDALLADSWTGEFSVLIDTRSPSAELRAAVVSCGDVEAVNVGDQSTDAGRRARHIRVDIARLDTMVTLIGEMVTERGRLFSLAQRHGDPELEDALVRTGRLTEALRAEVMQARLTQVWTVFDRFPRMVRELGQKLGKPVQFELLGREIELDRSVLEQIGDPLVHLLRNAIDHGIEAPEVRKAAGKPAAGRISLSAERDRAGVVIRVTDDGRGIDRDAVRSLAQERGLLAAGDQLDDETLIRVISQPGFSTAQKVSDVSGRGVGVDAVLSVVRRFGGSVEIETGRGTGTTFILRLPTTVDIARILLVGVGTERYAIPLHQIAETLERPRSGANEESMEYRGGRIPLRELRTLFSIGGTVPERSPVVVLEVGSRRAGVVVDRLAGQEEVVVHDFDPPGGTVPVFGGAALLGDGTPALVLDADGLSKEKLAWTR